MSSEIAEGRDVTISFNGERCIHARRCVMGEPAVFRANVEGPWMAPDGAPADDLMRVAYACPSGAITLTRKDGGAAEHAPRANMVTIRENGPLHVHAEMMIEGQGTMYRATLCRCGLSRNKPFCDNVHG